LTSSEAIALTKMPRGEPRFASGEDSGILRLPDGCSGGSAFFAGRMWVDWGLRQPPQGAAQGTAMSAEDFKHRHFIAVRVGKSFQANAGGAGVIVLAVAATVVGAFTVGRLVSPPRSTPGQEAAQVIEERMAPLPDSEAVEDERLTRDANEAGYRWAERRLLSDATDCPNFSPAFHTGCADYVRDRRQP